MAEDKVEGVIRPSVPFELVHDVSLALLTGTVVRLRERKYGTMASPLEVIGALEMGLHKVKEAYPEFGNADQFEEELMNLASSVIFAIACKRAGLIEL